MANLYLVPKTEVVLNLSGIIYLRRREKELCWREETDPAWTHSYEFVEESDCLEAFKALLIVLHVPGANDPESGDVVKFEHRSQ